MSDPLVPLQLHINKNPRAQPQDGGETATGQDDGEPSGPRITNWTDLISLTRNFLVAANRADFSKGHVIDLVVNKPRFADESDSDAESSSSDSSLDPVGEAEMLSSTPCAPS